MKILFLDLYFSTLKCILNVCWLYKIYSNIAKINRNLEWYAENKILFEL